MRGRAGRRGPDLYRLVRRALRVARGRAKRMPGTVRERTFRYAAIVGQEAARARREVGESL
jgi:hypothetical protein